MKEGDFCSDGLVDFEQVFDQIDQEPLGAASIGQAWSWKSEQGFCNLWMFLPNLLCLDSTRIVWASHSSG